MGNVHEVALFTPLPDYSTGRQVEAGLRDLGFSPLDGNGPELTGATAWGRFSLKLPLEHPTVDALKEAVLALPWKDWGVPTHLRVVWMDEHTTEDDSMGGRVSPHGWNIETWEVPRR